MKTLVGVLIVGALSTTGAFAGAAGTSPNVAGNERSIAAPRVPFRHYQKQPLAAPPGKPNGIEATER